MKNTKVYSKMVFRKPIVAFTNITVFILDFDMTNENMEIAVWSYVLDQQETRVPAKDTYSQLSGRLSPDYNSTMHARQIHNQLSFTSHIPDCIKYVCNEKPSAGDLENK